VYKFYAQVLRESNLYLKIIWQIYRSKLCIKVICINYDIPKIETRGKKKTFEKKEGEEAQRNYYFG
jgi:hypothetical protein